MAIYAYEQIDAMMKALGAGVLSESTVRAMLVSDSEFKDFESAAKKMCAVEMAGRYGGTASDYMACSSPVEMEKHGLKREKFLRAFSPLPSAPHALEERDSQPPEDPFDRLAAKVKARRG